MDKSALKDVLYGSIEELLKSKEFYYHSSVNHTYSHLTESGKEAVLELMEFMAWKILQTESEELDRRAKQQVIDGLSK